jgi:mRNA-degrading endonuclease YafQ of YafQ-DinJ toxin-antitoxin module
MPLDRGQTYDKYANTYIDSLGAPGLLNKRLTWNQKKARDFAWAKECIHFVDGQHNCYGDKDNVKRILMNYDLANGLGERAMQNYGDNYMIPELQEEGFNTSDIYGNIQHHPIIQQVYNAIVGEQQQHPLTPLAIDVSGFSMSQTKRKRLELIQEYLHEQVVAPIFKNIQAQVQKQYQEEFGIKDLYAMSPEQQMQFESDVAQRTKASTPKEITEYMRKDYKSPGSIQAQKILDYIMSDLNIKFLTDENFKNFLIAGEEVYRVGIRHNKSYIEIVNPLGFYHIARPNSIFIEDGIAWKYEQYVMPNDIYSWHGEEIGNSRILSDKLDILGVSHRRKFGEPHPQAVYEIQNGNTGYVTNAPNILTKEGQDYLQSYLRPEYGRGEAVNGEVRYVHCAWKGLRKLKQIVRYNSDKDRKKSIFIDESYVFNPLKVDENGYRDIEEYTMWAPQIWEGTQVGNDIYLGIGPTEYQYKSLSNPWEVKGPYVGGSYSKLMNNTAKISPIDPAKPWQYKFNLQMARIHELEATDLGNVLSTTLNSIPLDWSYKKHFLMMKYGKLAITDTTREGYDPNTSQIIKQLDLSTTNQIADRLQYLDFLRHQIILSMNYNPSRLGLQGPSVPVTNNQQNIIQSSYQTNDIFNMHNKIVENLLNVAVDVTKHALRENDDIRGYVLDDLSIADLDLNWELLDLSEINVKIRNNSQEYQNLLEVKQLLQPLAQNGMLTAPDIIRIKFSKSAAEIMNYAEDAFEKSQQRAQEAQEAQKQMLQQQEQMQMQLQQMQQQFELEKQRRDHEMELAKATIAATDRAQQKDIDMNKINDDITLEIIKQEGKLRELIEERHLKEQEMEEASRNLDKELKAKKEIERIKASRPKGSS